MEPRSTPASRAHRPFDELTATSARARRVLIGLSAAGVLATSGGLGSAAEPDRSVDATCAWGRLADGKGKLLRCLTREEAQHLRDATPPAITTPDLPAPISAAPPAEAPVSPEASIVPAESAFLADVGQVVADEGALPDALKNLKKAKERFAECADRNGGLTADRGEVELRFLVQGKGRAEGVSVKKRRGVGELAAKCVADVVDRRYVGYPEAPAVGATVVVTITKKKR